MAFNESDTSLVCVTDAVSYELSGLAVAARLVTALTSCTLVCFYSYQYSKGRCTLYSIYVQSITAIVYGVSATGQTAFLYAPMVFGTEIRKVMLGRYLVWVSTCPTILFGFLAVFSLMGPPVKPSKINFMVMKDLITLAAGVMSTFQTNNALKGFFLAIAVLVASGFLYELWVLEKVRHAYFEGKLWYWLRGTTLVFLTSWGIFPLLFFIGPPVLNISSFNGDVIGHAIGDLLAKNLFGFLLWWMRYKVILPHLEGKGIETSTIEVYNPGFQKTTDTVGRTSALVVPRKTKDTKYHAFKHTQVLVVESSIAYQRLIMYVLEEIGVDYVMAFDVVQAKQYLRRGHLDDFDAVLVNLSRYWSAPAEMTELKAHCTTSPFNIPVLGYSFDASEEHMLQREESECRMTNAVVLQMLDEAYVGNLVRNWKATAECWREEAKLDEEAAYQHTALLNRRQSEKRGFHGQQLSIDTSGGPERNSDANRDDEEEMYNTNGPSFTAPASPALQRGYASHPNHPQATSFDNTEPGPSGSQSAALRSQPLQYRRAAPAPNSSMPIKRTSSQPPSRPGSPIQQQEPMGATCSNGCGKPAEMICGGCNTHGYCSRTCQVHSWREGGHKTACATIAAVAAKAVSST